MTNALEVILEAATSALSRTSAASTARGRLCDDAHPLRGRLNPTTVRSFTDTYDTIEWLVKNIPEEQRQGRRPRHFLRWISALMHSSNPHPALKVAVPMNPMVDGWMGDGLVSLRAPFAN